MPSFICNFVLACPYCVSQREGSNDPLFGFFIAGIFMISTVLVAVLGLIWLIRNYVKKGEVRAAVENNAAVPAEHPRWVKAVMVAIPVVVVALIGGIIYLVSTLR